MSTSKYRDLMLVYNHAEHKSLEIPVFMFLMPFCYFYASVVGSVFVFAVNTEIGCINMTKLYSIFVNSTHLGDTIRKELTGAICIDTIQKTAYY